jgi:hypothetical protein
MAELGDPVRVIEVEPIRNPVPSWEPDPFETPDPIEKPEEVPA